MEQAFPVLPEWLSFRRVNARARKGVGIGPARLVLRYTVLFVIFCCIKFILQNACGESKNKLYLQSPTVIISFIIERSKKKIIYLKCSAMKWMCTCNLWSCFVPYYHLFLSFYFFLFLFFSLIFSTGPSIFFQAYSSSYQCFLIACLIWSGCC